VLRGEEESREGARAGEAPRRREGRGVHHHLAPLLPDAPAGLDPGHRVGSVPPGRGDQGHREAPVLHQQVRCERVAPDAGTPRGRHAGFRHSEFLDGREHRPDPGRPPPGDLRGEGGVGQAERVHGGDLSARTSARKRLRATATFCSRRREARGSTTRK
jgi:hypothetical protein